MYKICFAETSVTYRQGSARRVPCVRRVFGCHCIFSLETTSHLPSAIVAAKAGVAPATGSGLPSFPTSPPTTQPPSSSDTVHCTCFLCLVAGVWEVFAAGDIKIDGNVFYATGLCPLTENYADSALTMLAICLYANSGKKAFKYNINRMSNDSLMGFAEGLAVVSRCIISEKRGNTTSVVFEPGNSFVRL